VSSCEWSRSYSASSFLRSPATASSAVCASVRCAAERGGVLLLHVLLLLALVRRRRLAVPLVGSGELGAAALEHREPLSEPALRGGVGRLLRRHFAQLVLRLLQVLETRSVVPRAQAGVGRLVLDDVRAHRALVLLENDAPPIEPRLQQALALVDERELERETLTLVHLEQLLHLAQVHRLEARVAVRVVGEQLLVVLLGERRLARGELLDQRRLALGAQRLVVALARRVVGRLALLRLQRLEHGAQLALLVLLEPHFGLQARALVQLLALEALIRLERVAREAL
jgi:hypothetical protein